ncbi:MAG: peroxide stress protein YaaA [Herbaspirillum sp.]
MLIVLSPAKSLDYQTPIPTSLHDKPDFIDRSAQLVAILKAYSPAQIASLMRISNPLAQLNATRYAAWSRRFTAKNSRQALFAFNGDVYEGLQAFTLTATQLDYAQSHVRILSGLYGVLRPLDWMQPYRLEMGINLANPAGKNLYDFWGATVTAELERLLVGQRTPVLLNLASEEYFKVVQRKQFAHPLITPVFQDWKGGQYKIISFYAKRARGLMTRYAIEHRVAQPERLKDFSAEGYAFDAEVSDATRWVFRRRLAA